MQETLKIGAMKYREIPGNFVVVENRPLLYVGSNCISLSLRNVGPSEIRTRTTLACCTQIGWLLLLSIRSRFRLVSLIKLRRARTTTCVSVPTSHTGKI